MGGQQNWRRFSNFCSILCLLDCTVLPLTLALLSVLGLSVNDDQGWICDLNHKAFFYFMLPVASTTTILNFLKLKNFFLLFSGVFGIFLGYIGHAHVRTCIMRPLLDKIMTSSDLDSLHKFTEKHHTTLSVVGMLVFITTNYIAHQFESHPSCGKTHRKVKTK